jgi:hypothetical protein
MVTIGELNTTTCPHDLALSKKICVVPKKKSAATLAQKLPRRLGAQKHLRQSVGRSSGPIHQPTASFAVPKMNFPDPVVDNGARIGPYPSGRVPYPRRRRCLCVPCSNRGNKLDDRHAAQMERLSAARNPNKSQVFPVKEPNGSRIPPGRFSLPCGKACNASESNNRVPGKRSDQQR